MKMRRWEDVKIRRCEEDVKMWRWEEKMMWRWEDVKIRWCEDGKMWRWEDVMTRCDDKPPLSEEPFAQTLSRKMLGKMWSGWNTAHQPEWFGFSQCPLADHHLLWSRGEIDVGSSESKLPPHLTTTADINTAFQRVSKVTVHVFLKITILVFYLFRCW